MLKDEKVTVNLGFFLLPLPLALLATLPLPARTIPSPALIIPFPPVNKLANKLAPNVPSNILKNPPLFFSFILNRVTYSF